MNTALDKQKSAEQDEHADEDLKDAHVLFEQFVIFTLVLLQVPILNPDSCAGRVSNG